MLTEHQTLSDEDLARQTQAGSLPAFDELIARYHRRIYAFVAQSCSCASDAAEITQETFIKAFQAIGTFNRHRAFAPWLFTIARHKCIDHHRAAPPVSDAAMPDLVARENPAEQLAQQEDRQGLWALARRRLPDTQFQALWLRYAEEMSIEAIAQVLRKTRTHVKVLLFRARQALARELESAGAPARLPAPPLAARTQVPEPTNRKPASPLVCRRSFGIPITAGKRLL